MSVHHGNRLKYLIEKNKLNVVQIAANLNVARGTLYNYFAQEEIPRKKLLKVCEAAGIDISEFDHDLEMNDPATDYRVLQERVKSLERMIHDKEVIIISQQEIINLLKKEKSKTK